MELATRSDDEQKMHKMHSLDFQLIQTGVLILLPKFISHSCSGENGSAGMEDQTPPPEYLYDDELLSKPLYGPGRRSRLITL